MNKKRNTDVPRVGFIFWPIFAYAGVFYLVEFVVAFVLTAGRVAELQSTGGAVDYNSLAAQLIGQLNNYQYELSAAASLVSIPVIWKFFYKKDRLRNGVVTVVNGSFGSLPLALVLGFAASLCLNGFLSISGLMNRMSANVEEVTSILYQGRLLIELIGIGFIAPVAEELLFRGVVMNRMKEDSPERSIVPIVFSAILFGCYHGNMIQALYSGILGLILGYVYEKDRRLAAPICVHIGANLMSVLGSETKLLNGLFASDLMQFFTTGVSCVIILICLYLMEANTDHAETETINKEC